MHFLDSVAFSDLDFMHDVAERHPGAASLSAMMLGRSGRVRGITSWGKAAMSILNLSLI